MHAVKKLFAGTDYAKANDGDLIGDFTNQYDTLGEDTSAARYENPTDYAEPLDVLPDDYAEPDSPTGEDVVPT